MIKIILVDDHRMFREGLKYALSHIEDFIVTGEASDGKEFLKLLDNTTPDVILMDIGMPGMNGEEATSVALSKFPDLKIIALSMLGDTEYYRRMVNAGVCGFLLKETGLNELTKAIRTVYEGKTYFSQELLQRIIKEMTNVTVRSSRQRAIDLTKREEEVLELICKGYNNKEIADLLSISQKTVEGHKSNLMDKTNTKNSINLMLFSIKNNLISFSFLSKGKPL